MKATLEQVASHLCKLYGNSIVGYLRNKNGNIIPKCYVHYASNTIFTRNNKLANKYTYFEL